MTAVEELRELVVQALPLPGEVMTAQAYERVVNDVLRPPAEQMQCPAGHVADGGTYRCLVRDVHELHRDSLGREW